MAWPATAVVTGDPVTTIQLNGLPVMLANTTLSGDAANIQFASIPGHYAHLLLVCYLRSDAAVNTDTAAVRFNTDAAGNYDFQTLTATAAAPAALENFAQTQTPIGTATGNNGAANLFSAVRTIIPHYVNAANNKAVVSQYSGKFGTATGNIGVGRLGGFWRSIAAINQVTLFVTGGNLRAGSRATLYGLA